MIRFYMMLFLFTFAGRLFGQYDTLKDPRRGGVVRYAGDIAAKPNVMVPKQLRIDRNSFRGVWVATVENIDFPVCSSESEFKRNYLEVVNNLRAIGANAILFQVRPMNDALYSSRLNPWSRFLTGAEGRALPGGFDPLPFMIQEAHKRGLEFHAWLNPYRLTGKTDLGKQAYLNTLSRNNFARNNPSLVLSVRRNDGKNLLIFDPGNPKTIQFLVDTVRELITKYPVDGIHMDDYFYPYEGVGNADRQSYQNYNRRKLPLEDWRRANVDTLICSISNLIRTRNFQARKKIQFGISPFGIWANYKTNPAGSLTSGSESYILQHADTRKWMRNGWIDYIVPQLYWTFGHNTAAYAALSDWWAKNAEASPRTKLYIGHAPARLGTTDEWSSPDEILNQFRYNSRKKAIRGSVLFSYRSLFKPSNPVMKNGVQKIAGAWKNSIQ